MTTKKCVNCGEKIEKDFVFCPYCGIDIMKEEERRNFGMLGRDDEDLRSLGLGSGLFGGSMFNGLFNNIMKQMNEQMKDMDFNDKDFEQGKPKVFKRGIKINIGMGNGNPIIRVNELGNINNKQEKIKEAKLNNIIDLDKLRRLSELPKEEAHAIVRRLSNKIIYEIELPGVKSMKDILINKLENGIEIKALSKEKSYFKVIPINLPIVKYDLEKGKLFLELKPQN